LQPFHLAEQAFKPAAEHGRHGRRRFLRRGAKPGDFAIQPGKIERVPLGKTCLCLGQAFPHGLDGSQHRKAMLCGW